MEQSPPNLLEENQYATSDANETLSEASPGDFGAFICEMKERELILTSSPSVNVLVVMQEKVEAAETCAVSHGLTSAIVSQVREKGGSSLSWMVVGQAAQEVKEVANELEQFCNQPHRSFGTLAATTIGAMLATWTGLALA